MIKSFYYELQKLICSRIMWGLLLLLSIGVGILFVIQDGKDDVPSSAYKKLNNEIEDKDTQDSLNYASERLIENEEKWGQWLSDSYGENIIPAGRYCSDIYKDKLFLDTIKKEIEECAGYSEFLASIQENAKKFTTISFFAKEGFAKDNVEKTAKDYQKLQGISVSYTKSRGIGKMLVFLPRILFGVFAAFLMGLLLLADEKEKGLLSLCRAQTLGRGNNMVARIFAVLAFSFIWNLLFYISSLLISSIIYGFPVNGFFSEPMQALFGFSDSVLKINIFSFLLLCFLCEWLFSFTFALFVMLLGTLFKDSLPVYVTCFLIIAAEVILYVKINNFSTYENFKYINIVAFANAPKCIGNYKNINVFGHPVFYGVLVAFVTVILSVILSILSPVIYSKKAQDGRQIKNTGLSWKILKRFRCQHTSLLRHEAYKLFISEKVLFIIMAAGLYAFLSFRTVGWKNPDINEQFYSQYVREFSGAAVNEESDKSLLDLEYKIEEQVSKHAENFADAKIYGLNKLKEYRDYLSRENDRYYVWSEGWERLFNDKEKNAVLGICAVFLLAICLSGISSKEKSSGMSVLLNSSMRGKKPVILIKLFLSLLVTALIFIFIYIRYYLQINGGYDLSFGKIRADSIIVLEKVPSFISLSMYIIYTFVKRFLALVLCGLMIFFVGHLTGSYLYTVLITIGIVILPLLLVLMKISGAEYLLLNLLLV